jgi:hypothetical protein
MLDRGTEKDHSSQEFRNRRDLLLMTDLAENNFILIHHDKMSNGSD